MAIGHLGFIFIGILFVFAVIAILWWGFSRLWPLLPLPEPIKTILYVIIVVVVSLFLLDLAYNIFFGGGVRSLSWN